MNRTIPPALAVIQDLSGIGRCSLSVALPVISACGVQACPLPTAVFSAHTGYSSFFKKDLSSILPGIFSSWEQLKRHWDGIYCGYLGNQKQMHIIASYIEKEKQLYPDTKIILDPVMGDNGKIYQSLSPDYAISMKAFVSLADLITPNITEACILSNTPFSKKKWSDDMLLEISKKLHRLGPAKIIITGIHEKEHFHNYIFDADTNQNAIYSVPVSGAARPGTGDLFASIISALCLKGFPLFESVKTAADFIANCVKISEEADVPVCEGVIFENCLSLLTDLSNL